MIKPTLKTLSFAFVTLASASVLMASEQGPSPDRSAAPADSARAGCAARADIDLGWEEQLALVEKRLAEKEAEGLRVPGAIIAPPFETFAPYRTDVPPTVTAAGAGAAARRLHSDPASRD